MARDEAELYNSIEDRGLPRNLSGLYQQIAVVGDMYRRCEEKLVQLRDLVESGEVHLKMKNESILDHALEVTLPAVHRWLIDVDDVYDTVRASLLSTVTWNRVVGAFPQIPRNDVADWLADSMQVFAESGYGLVRYVPVREAHELDLAVNHAVDMMKTIKTTVDTIGKA